MSCGKIEYVICLGAGVDVDTHSQNENGEGNKEKQGVDKHSFPICLEASKLEVPGVPG